MPYTVAAMNLQFGDFLLLREERRLRGPGGTVELGDRSCDVLCTLLEASGQVVTKQALMDAVWHGVVVEENTLQVHVSALRKALGPLHIQTVHGRGYKYIGPKPRLSVANAGHNGLGVTELSSLERAIRRKDSKKTSVAVLPFSTATDDRACLLLADGLVEDLITELARYRHLSVIGHRISSHYRESGNARDAIFREVGVDFLIDGSVREGPGAIRVAVQLVDAETGAVAWGDRFSRELGDVFAMQDEIVGAVVARLAFNLDEAAERQRRRDPTSSDSAYVHFLRARALWRNGAAAGALESALKAIEIDPDYGRAHAYVAYFHAFGRFGQWFDLDLSELDANATSAIGRALAVDPTDPFILQRASMTYLMLGDPAAALRYADAAAQQSALDSEILVIRGMSLACCGRKDEGAELLERAIALEPRLAPGCYSALAEVRHMQRDYGGSQAVLDVIPNPQPYIDLLKAANLARMGEIDAARAIVDAIPPDFDCELFSRSEAKMCAMADDAEHWIESFRCAGVRI